MTDIKDDPKLVAQVFYSRVLGIDAETRKGFRRLRRGKSMPRRVIAKLTELGWIEYDGLRFAITAKGKSEGAIFLS